MAPTVMAEIPSPVFPQELFDFIIDYLHNDKDTLRSCSLASKRLVDTSFYHLFDSVTFKILPGEERRPGGRLWNDLVAFVTGESRAVRYIRRLYLDTVDPPTVFNYTSDSPRAYPVVLLQNIVSVLRHIPSLQHVGIYHIMIVTNSIGGNVDRVYENGTRRLQSLSLCWCGLDDRVLALPSITRAIAPLKLSLHHIRCISNRSSPSSIPEASATSSCPVSNLQIIGAFPICGSTDDQDLQLVTSNLMPSLYSSLRELTLIGREHEGSTVLFSPTLRFALRNAPMLQSIIIGISLFSMLDLRTQWNEYVPLISSLPLCIKCIRFDILPFGGFILKDTSAIPLALPDATTLYQALLRLPVLRACTFRWGLRKGDLGVGVEKALLEQVSRLIPEMSDEGIIRCELKQFNQVYRSIGVPTDLGPLFSR